MWYSRNGWGFYHAVWQIRRSTTHTTTIYPTPQYYLWLDNVTEKHKKNSVCSSISPANRTSTIIGIHKNMSWHYKTKKLKLPITHNINNSFAFDTSRYCRKSDCPTNLSDCPTTFSDCPTNLSSCWTKHLIDRLTVACEISGVASPKIWGAQNIWFLANDTILIGKTPLKAQNDYIFQKFVGPWPLWPPWLRLCVKYLLSYCVAWSAWTACNCLHQ